MKYFLIFNCLLYLNIAFAKVCISPLSVVPQVLDLNEVDLITQYEQEKSKIADDIVEKISYQEKQKILSQHLQANNKKHLDFFMANNSQADIVALQRRLQLVEAKKIHQSINEHSVVGFKNYMSEHAREVGFCFGRAAYVHFEILKLGVHPESIRKIFAIGGLFTDDISWEFHVATMFQDQLGNWWVIDSLQPEILTLVQWVQSTSRWDANRVNPKLRYYITEAYKFLPLQGYYSEQKFKNNLYKNYFVKLLNWYGKPENCIVR